MAVRAARLRSFARPWSTSSAAVPPIRMVGSIACFSNLVGWANALFRSTRVGKIAARVCPAVTAVQAILPTLRFCVLIPNHHQPVGARLAAPGLPVAAEQLAHIAAAPVAREGGEAL